MVTIVLPLRSGQTRVWAAVLIATKHQHPRSQDADAFITDGNIRRVAKVMARMEVVTGPSGKRLLGIQHPRQLNL